VPIALLAAERFYAVENASEIALAKAARALVATMSEARATLGQRMSARKKDAFPGSGKAA
jgi:hypothetical protein